MADDLIAQGFRAFLETAAPNAPEPLAKLLKAAFFTGAITAQMHLLHPQRRASAQRELKREIEASFARLADATRDAR